MRSVKLLTEALRVAAGIADRWYVSTGEGAVGPVRLELIARGIEAGKVPLDSYVRNEAWTVWRPLSDIARVTVADQGSPHEIVHPVGTFQDLVVRDSQPTLRQTSGWDDTPTPVLGVPYEPTLREAFTPPSTNA